jgi:hypothetical protein
LTDRTVTNSAKPSSPEFELGLILASGRIAGEADHLGAVFDSIRIAPVSAELALSVDFLYLISLSAVGIPRLVFGSNPGEVFRFPVDLAFYTGYSEEVYYRACRHFKNPGYFSQLRICYSTGVFAFYQYNSSVFLYFLQRSQQDRESTFLSLPVIFAPEVIPHSLKERLRDYEGISQRV